jgi:hypothetical protein
MQAGNLAAVEAELHSLGIATKREVLHEFGSQVTQVRMRM